MNGPAYPVARAAAERILPHFVSHWQTAAEQDGVALAPLPGIDAIATMIDAVFWASLRREEGIEPKISIAYAEPDDARTPMRFEKPISLTPHNLSKLAPAVERPGIHLGVNGGEGPLCIWGATRQLPALCFVLEVVAPGLLVVKHSRGEEAGKFVNIAVLEADRIQVIDQQTAGLPDCPALLTSLLGLESRFAPAHSVNVLIQLAVSMRAHGRGGALLVVPAASDGWRESILSPITYSVSPAFEVLKRLMQVEPEERPQDALRRAVDGLAGLTAVDGATIVSDNYELLAFGAKIIRRPRHATVASVLLTEPIEGTSAVVVEPAELGGTRHLSAAQFAHDQRDAIALVASQDGRFTVFGWSPCENMVHAHRIESLLL